MVLLREPFYKPENIQQDYTSYQKQDESGLNYAQARYYNSSHGRFTSVDPLTASASIRDPQTFNRYSYALNSPYKFSDPLGLVASEPYGACGTWCPGKGDWVDGSAFHGTDATFEHLKTTFEIARDLVNRISTELGGFSGTFRPPPLQDDYVTFVSYTGPFIVSADKLAQFGTEADYDAGKSVRKPAYGDGDCPLLAQNLITQ